MVGAFLAWQVLPDAWHLMSSISSTSRAGGKLNIYWMVKNTPHLAHKRLKHTLQ